MRAPRGQNMVLLALTTLLVTLMVTMTIGLGLRIRQKHELQNLADAAVFTNAVATARVFNNNALTNRVEVSYWVAQAADQSLIDWTSYARAMTSAAEDAANNASGGCAADGGASADLAGFRNAVKDYRNNTMPLASWRTMDNAAGDSSAAIQGQISALRDYADTAGTSLQSLIDCSGLTTQVINQAHVQQVTCINNHISRNEVFEAFGGAGLTTFSDDGAWSVHMLYAAMGTRGGEPFITGRGVVPDKVAGDIAQIAANHHVTFTPSAVTGSAYWAASMNHGTSPETTFAWADDHGSVTVGAGSCSGTSPVTSHLRSTDLENHADDHTWAPDDGQDDTHADEIDRHTMGKCTICPSVWVRTGAFKPRDSEGDAWGQPKLLVALQRNVGVQRFPWELQFSFGKDSTKWDGTSMRFPLQTAYATAIVYYHRHGQGQSGWQEFPNLLNPFWRATLAPADVDGSPRDVTTAIPQDAWNALLSNGYKGIH